VYDAFDPTEPVGAGPRWGKTPAEIELGKLAAGVGGVAASVAGAVVAGGVPGAAGALVGATLVCTAASAVKELASAVRWTQPLRRRGELGSQSSPVEDLIVAVNGLLSELSGAFTRPVLIAIDGLDRVKGREGNARLWGDTDLLSRIAAPTVAVGSVVFQRSGMGGQPG
jgi:hypothetical protein